MVHLPLHVGTVHLVGNHAYFLMQGCVSQTSIELSFPTLPMPPPTLVISKVAAETDQVIALSQDLMKHKTPKVHGSLIRAAFQTPL